MSQKRAPVPSSSSSEAEIPLDSAEAASDRADSHGYASEASHLSRQPSEHHRSSPGRTSPGSSHERSYQSSSERTSPLQAEQPEDDLQFVSHQPPPEGPSDGAVNPASTLGDGKFTAPRSSGFLTPPGTSRHQAPEAPVSRVSDTVNSVLLVSEQQQQQQQQSTPPQLAKNHPRERNSPGLPVDPSRPATVQSRLPPVGSPDPSRRVVALEDDNDDNLAGGMRGNGSAEAAQAAPLQRSGDVPPYGLIAEKQASSR